MAKDLRIECENREGQLAAIGEALGKVGVNLDGFSATVGAGQGFIHLLVEDAGTARQALEGAGFTVSTERDALVLDGVEDRPGYLGEMARKLADAGINIDVAYLATNTRIVFGVDDVDRARAAL
ncbi:MAG: ACT domain-containing protein [Acidimicrobiales bacterium]